MGEGRASKRQINLSMLYLYTGEVGGGGSPTNMTSAVLDTSDVPLMIILKNIRSRNLCMW